MANENIEFVESPVTVAEYNALRETAGWHSMLPATVNGMIEGSLFFVHAKADNQVVGIARVIGDGAYNFYVQDVIVDPEYQRYGIGTGLMERVLGYIGRTCKDPGGAKVGLFSSEGKEPFYERFGFERRPMERRGAGMQAVVYNEKGDY